MNAQTIDYTKLQRQVDAHPYPLLFTTISGAHLYGFPSADSDFDLRGVHLLPLEQVVGLDPGEETVEKEGIHDGLEIDLVTHDAKKFFTLMLKKNGYVLEQLLSPLVVHTTPEHEELKAIAADCITRHHAHHYLGFAATQWKLFNKDNPPKGKPLLYVYRVLLTGIHLMRTGNVEANLLTLNRAANLPYIDELVERKLAGAEKGTLDAADLEFHKREYARLVGELEAAMEKSTLPEQSTGKAALNDLLLRLRTKAMVTHSQNTGDISIQGLVDSILTARCEDERGRLYCELVSRDKSTILQLARTLSRSHEAERCCLGVRLMGNLGSSDTQNNNESIAVLARVLREQDSLKVLVEALKATHTFGAANDLKPLIMVLTQHRFGKIRAQAASALSEFVEDDDVVRRLADLTRDEDPIVRDWATFVLGEFCDVRSAFVADVLAERLTDRHYDTRCEALVGLAKRHDTRTIGPLQDALSADSVGKLAIEAAVAIASPLLFENLVSLRDWWDVDEALLEEAIAACTPESK